MANSTAAHAFELESTRGILILLHTAEDVDVVGGVDIAAHNQFRIGDETRFCDRNEDVFEDAARVDVDFGQRRQVGIDVVGGSG